MANSSRGRHACGRRQIKGRLVDWWVGIGEIASRLLGRHIRRCYRRYRFWQRRRGGQRRGWSGDESGGIGIERIARSWGVWHPFIVWDLFYRGWPWLGRVDQLYLGVIRIKRRDTLFRPGLFLFRVRLVWVLALLDCLEYARSIPFGIFNLFEGFGLRLAPDVNELEEGGGGLECAGCLSVLSVSALLRSHQLH